MLRANDHPAASSLQDSIESVATEHGVDPLENITGGTRYLRTLLDSYDGNVALSLAAYNAGPGRVKDTIPNIPETRTYVARVLRHYASYRKAR